MQPFYSPSRQGNQHEGLHQVHGGISVFLDREDGCEKTLCLTTGLFAMPHKQDNPVLAGRKFLRPLHLLHLTAYPPDCNPLDHYVCGTVERETNKTLSNTEDELKASITETFTYLNKKNLGKVTGDSEVAWKPWSKPLAISLNKINILCNFGKYIWKRCDFYFHFCKISTSIYQSYTHTNTHVYRYYLQR